MNILEAMISIGIQPVSATSRYGWFEAPRHALERPEIFASALYNQWYNVKSPEFHGDAYLFASYLMNVPLDEAKKMLGPVDPMTTMPGRDIIHRTSVVLDRVKPISTDTAINAVLKSQVSLDKALRNCKDFTYNNGYNVGRRVFGLYNLSGGVISLDFSGHAKDLITKDLALIPGDGSMVGSCLLVVGMDVFLRIDEAREDVILLPSSNVINRAISFLSHYQTIACVCPSYSLMHELHRNLPSANIQFSPIEPMGLWNGTLFS